MGEETTKSRYSKADEKAFAAKLLRETATIRHWEREGKFSSRKQYIGQEVEFCLTDHSFLPASINAKFLKQLASPQATTELAAFNVEYNSHRTELGPGFILRMRQDFVDFMQRAFNVAEMMSIHLVMAGILPTISPADLGTAMTSRDKRYHALLERFVRWRGGRFSSILIPENDGLELGLSTVLMEAVTTSQQLHLQPPAKQVVQYYNAAQLLAGPIAAATANSPFFLGRNLWAETRVPLFEQILRPRFLAPGLQDERANDFFGHSYVSDSLLELYEDNAKYFAVMLAEVSKARHGLPHLRLHNGTIWRWNRPVVDFEEDGTPTLRIEHRVMSSSPSSADMCANIALFVGLMRGLVRELGTGLKGPQLERQLPCAQARANFYACALHGLDAKVTWLDGRRRSVKKLLLDQLLPLARRELKQLRLESRELEYLDIMEQRIATGVNGATWQRRYVQAHGAGSAQLRRLTGSYWRRQLQGMPVHRWSL